MNSDSTMARVWWCMRSPQKNKNAQSIQHHNHFIINTLSHSIAVAVVALCCIDPVFVVALRLPTAASCARGGSMVPTTAVHPTRYGWECWCCCCCSSSSSFLFLNLSSLWLLSSLWEMMMLNMTLRHVWCHLMRHDVGDHDWSLIIIPSPHSPWSSIFLLFVSTHANDVDVAHHHDNYHHCHIFRIPAINPTMR